MKIRTGFVSNSSSSSFIVSLNNISAAQLLKLKEYNGSDSWTFTVDENNMELHGYTNMDNNDLSEYMEKHGIDDSEFDYNY
jgi:hypothetical protein